MTWTIVCPVCSGTLMGVEIRGVYDGILFFQCMDCSKPFHRFEPDESGFDKAAPFIRDIELQLSDTDG